MIPEGQFLNLNYIASCLYWNLLKLYIAARFKDNTHSRADAWRVIHLHIFEVSELDGDVSSIIGHQPFVSKVEN
jgi:hypothetical protein